MAGLRGILAALTAETSETVPYIAKTPELPAGHILLPDAQAALDRIAQAFDAALAQAVTAVETRISKAARPPVSAQGRTRIRACEHARQRLYATRASAGGLPAHTLALAKTWEARS